MIERERRGYWSPALPIVLEKNGYLGVESHPPSAVSDTGFLRAFDCGIVARLQADSWRDELIEALLRSERPLLLEPPLPRRLLQELGISSAEPLAPPLPDLTLSITDAGIAERAGSFGYRTGGRIGPPRSHQGPGEQRNDWSALGTVPLEPDQAAAWREPGYDVEQWTLEADVELLAEWRNEQTGERHPAVVRRGRLIAASFSLAAFLVRAHTAEPWYRGERRLAHRYTGIEHLLLALIDELHASAGSVRARVQPWPSGARWALNIRHDFDRPLARSRVAEIVSRHDQLGTAATWYWRARHLRAGLRRVSPRRAHREGNAAIREVVRAPRQEVAHHTERLWAGAEREQRTIEALAGRRIRGASSHGDPACFRFQGAPNVLWAEQQGLLYTELIQHSHFQPHRFPVLASDGIVSPLNVICLPHHESFDRSTAPGDFAMEKLAAAPETWAPVAGMLQVMSHPDINIDPLFELLAGMTNDGRLDWTAERCAEWWRRTHVIDQFELRALGGGRFACRSRKGVEGVVLELRSPDGTTTLHTLDLEAGVEMTVGG